jgi:hypothetical protein
MKTTLLLVLATLVGGGCCPTPRWPADVKAGVTVSMTVTGEANAMTGKVLEVEGDWLKVNVRGTAVHIAREKIVEIMLVDP